MLGTVDVMSNGTTLIATAYYDDTTISRPVRLDFGRVEAFKIYEEFSDPAISSAPPMMRDPISGNVPWPFQEVVDSRWVRSVLARNGALNGRSWQHFTIVTVDVILHVMTDSPLKAERIDG
ncbi:hypothetical protein [Sphingomonas sp. TREG-RG-20F-R18-01]|uniref:hypothetical protein n=1 Tax=Sphingomonas sp. TREG-RG-20F-R18-01 TaxID=2914982 RepID=UPI001F56EF6A|nr:hypothetical protein [Sphingomonas sp. TREG-RG-20F-R18-01]